MAFQVLDIWWMFVFFQKNMVEMVEFHLQIAEPLFEVAKKLFG